MTDSPITIEPIGTIHTPFDSPEGMPIQPAGADTEGAVELQPAYAPGLADLAGFSHCILVYHFHESHGDASLRVEPFLDDVERGLFATRAPQRPNGIGLSVVTIESVDEETIHVQGIDVVDGTPLLDVKPFVPAFDVPDDTETGWMDASQADVHTARADDRFQ
ncbi:tRNA (N6-threonylcarbamoyladenosine(37)-N6)-methyltransferase TrmO [Halorhabdus sp. CBA1104]|uniref:tRNA (N6-threonylcarbamoyladenosine(37)-N6)-methyltransferase TrmO n=1 Tax=Halorhabdus sp. CBA1104 TaxID=1380432 RepID=UPI0012B31B33|nr:tRNA (N6-threonylcarbamoyladenosine(37)-N6)-methyltransferase TrmO [Halorhabdus sp. CBA1104]QGN07743.1 tRNA (N6-threonylcarbamoyladenosine(37)-N6)-methyltransferase TrmO [Halorhabdus sp. CBA1104]